MYTAAEIAHARKILEAVAGVSHTPEKPKRKSKAKPSDTPFARLAASTPVRKGKGSKFTLTLGDLTFACEDRGNGKIVAETTNSHGDTRWIVFRPSDPTALTSGAYLAVVARRYGLVK